MKKFLYLMIIIGLLVSTVSCGNSNPKQDNQIPSSETMQTENSDAAAQSTETVSVPTTLRFVDALGEWHETEILSTAAKHPYNWELLTNDDSGISYIGDENYTIRKGVDVSKWQGNVDWEKVRADGYEFAFIRLGFRGYAQAGGLDMDSKFYQNINGAKAAGLDVGVYFFSQAINEEEALEEAEYVLKALEGYDLELPIVYDPELIRDMEARTDNVSGEQFTKNTIVFCEAIKAAGFEPMIYSNMIWEAFLFDMTQLQDYPFWYADYESIPQTPYNFTFWQYSEKGKVNGIDGYADLNIQFVPAK